MSEYVPTTEDVRDWYAHKGGSTLSPYYASKLTRRMNEFDAWLAQHDAEAQATALEEAADEMEGGFNADTLNLERRQIKRWLRARAARIREGKQK